jgi:glycerol-3-phosphate dehydrogenase
MNRDNNLKIARERNDPWDIVVIGGGATGAGCTLDAASRGFSVLLLEQHDFGKGTSSRSTKLIHGGVRYLRQGNISLVREALKERGLLLKNAPHAIRKQAFVIPCYGRSEKAFYGLGMKIYDRLSGKFGIGNSRLLSREETLEHLPTLDPNGLRGGVLYCDGQFDDARFLIDLLRTADSHGAIVLNYCKVDSLKKDENGRVIAVEFTDTETDEQILVNARAVINATGIFTDSIRQLSDAHARPLLTFAQGIHIVLDRKFLPSGNAVMIPKTSDGRVLFCIPWHDHVVVGTTDTPVETADLEPKALDREIDFVLETAGQYLAQKPTRADILSTFAGIRPLIANDAGAKTSSLSRGHGLFVDRSGLITITGGKWTTYRRMAEDAVDKAIEIGGLDNFECQTETLPIDPPEKADDVRLHPDMPYMRADVIRAVRTGMARTVEDVLARRTRMLFLDARSAIDSAHAVAEIMAAELDRDEAWKAEQCRNFLDLARSYKIDSPANNANERE